MAPQRTDRRAAAALASLLLLGGCRAPGDAPSDATERLAELPAPRLDTLEPTVAAALSSARTEAEHALEAAKDDRARGAALGKLARVYHAQGAGLLARAAYAAALDFAPDDVDLLYLAGQAELEATEPERAAGYLERAVALRPDDAHALAALSIARQQLGELDRALESAEAAVAADPGHGLGWLALAEAATQADRPERALDAYARFFELHPEASKYRVPYGLALRRAGRAADGAAQLERRGLGVPRISDPRLAALAGLRRGTRMDLVEATQLLEAGQLEAAVEKLERVVELDPDSADAHRALGAAFLRLGRDGLALEQFELAVRLAPDGSDERFALGVALARLGRDAEAETAYVEALERDANHLDSLQNLANLRLRSGRPALAEADYRRLRAADPSRGTAWLGIAAAESALGRDLAARETLAEGARALPRDWRLRAAWCRVASAARDPRVRDGAHAVEQARLLAASVRHPDVLVALAMALAETGDFPGAIDAQRRALAMAAPDSSPAYRARLERDLAGYLRGEPSRDPALY